MKQPFRFFRGEFSDGYLYKLHTFLNYYFLQEGFIAELVYNKNFQWKIEQETDRKGSVIREADVYNIGRIAGVSHLRGSFGTNLGSIWFTPAYTVNGRQVSERGFLDMDFESFVFRHCGEDGTPIYTPEDYTNPISKVLNDANPFEDFPDEKTLKYKMTYVPTEVEDTYKAKLLGYIYEDEEAFTEEGELIKERVHAEKPVGKAFIEFYGIQYMHYEMYKMLALPLPFQVYKLLVEVMQYLRRNGASTKTFLEATRILCENYVHDIEFVPHSNYVQANYSLHQKEEDKDAIYNRQRRFIVWKAVCAYKFKFIHIHDATNERV